MTEHRDDLDAALRRLRDTVRHRVPVPASAALRARAEHRVRVRRAATAVAAAAAVTAVAVGGSTLLRPAASPPVPPADSPTPPASPTPPPDPTAPPDRSPGPPSPRPTPLPVQPVDDPIAEVDWQAATITIPPRDGCPSGPVTLAPVADSYPDGIGPQDGYPRIAIGPTGVGYGDITGDGRIEAVLSTTCLTGAADSGDGSDQLLVVARDPGGELRGIAWVGPRGAAYSGYWVSDGALYVAARPYLGETFPWAPGMAWRYRWTGDGFDGPVEAPEYPPIHPVDGAGTGPTVRLDAVATGLGCPDRGLQFDPDGRARVGGVRYELYQPTAPSSGPHLVDLDGTGDRLVVAAIACIRDGGATTRGLAVFAHVEDGLRGIALLVPPGRQQVVGWRPELVPGSVARLVVQLDPGNGGLREVTYRWTGTALVPIDD